MCLKTVDKEVTVPDEGIGYKAMCEVSVEPLRLTSPYYPRRTYAVGTGRWLGSSQVKEWTDQGTPIKYMTGFHIYTTLRNCKYWAVGRDQCSTVVKVAYRGVLHTGRDCDGHCNIVAKEMKILGIV